MRTLRGAYGAFLLLAPRVALRCVGVGRRHGAAEVAVRALGARELAQAAFLADGSRLGAGVDALHAVSMAVLCAARAGPRRPAAASAAVSGAFALHALRRHR